MWNKRGGRWKKESGKYPRSVFARGEQEMSCCRFVSAGICRVLTSIRRARDPQFCPSANRGALRPSPFLLLLFPFVIFFLPWLCFPLSCFCGVKILTIFGLPTTIFSQILRILASHFCYAVWKRSWDASLRVKTRQISKNYYAAQKSHTWKSEMI